MHICLTCAKASPLIGYSPLARRWSLRVNLKNVSLPLDRCGPEPGLTACRAESRLGFIHPLTGQDILTCILYRDPGQGHGVEISGRWVLQSSEFYLPPVSQDDMDGVVVVNLGDTLGQVRILQLKSFSPGPKPCWSHFLIYSSMLLNNLILFL